MKFQATVFLAAALGGGANASIVKKVLYPLQDSTIFDGEDETAKGLGSNVVGMTENGARRALVQFDLSKVPLDAELKNVVLKIDIQHSKGEPAVKLFRVTSPWSAGTAEGENTMNGSMATNEDTTWKYSTFSTMPWKEVGGDFDPEVLSTEESGYFSSTKELQIVVQDMIEGNIPNYGFVLVGPEEGEVAFQTLGSMEGTGSEKPKLVLEYDSKEEPLVATPARNRLRKSRTLQIGNNGGDGAGGGGDADGGDGGGGGDEGDGGGEGGGDEVDGGGEGGGDGGDSGCKESRTLQIGNTGGDGGDGVGGAGDADGGDGGGGGDEGDVGGEGGGDEGDGGGDGCGDGDDGGDGGGGNGFAICFSGENTVEVMGQGLVRMDSIKIGDSVLVRGGEFAKIYSFGHHEKTKQSDYLQIRADGLRNALEISEDHMVFVIPDGSAVAKSVPASSIKVGDMLATENDTSSKVSKIKTVHRKGAYAPFTTSGDIVVSGVVASNYIAMIPEKEMPFGVTMQWIAHTFNAPHRFVCSINFSICENETYTDGLSNWIYLPFHAGLWLAQQNTAIKMAGSGFLVVLMALLSPTVLAVGFLVSKLNKTSKAL